MSQIVTVFDPATSDSTQFNAPNSSANGALVFFNESNVSINLSFTDGSTMYLPAWYHRHKCGAFGSVQVQWAVHQVLSSLAPPISEVIVESFQQGEPFPADGPLVRQTNVGNTINTVGGVASSVQNDGNTSGTSVVEATVQGQSSSGVLIENQGYAQLGTLASTGELVTIDGNGSSFNGIVRGGEGTFPLGVIANLITAQSGNDIGFHVATGQNVIATVNGVNMFSVNGNGPNLLSGTIGLLVGSISRINIFNQAVTTSLTAYNHGLGVKPTAIIMQLLGTSTTAATGKYDDTSMTTTQVKMISSVNATYRIIAIAI